MKLKDLSLLIGTWKTKGEIDKTPFGAAGKIVAKDRYAWAAHKSIILHLAEGKMAQHKFSNCEVISYDPAKQAFALFSFENGQTTGLMHGKLQRQRWTVGNELMRFKGQFNTKGTHLRGEWQYKTRQGEWKRWMKIDLRKVK